MIPDNFIIFIILFVLIYICEDSFFALFILFCVSLFEISLILTTEIAESEVVYLLLFVILLTYSAMSMYAWTAKFNIDGSQKLK